MGSSSNRGAQSSQKCWKPKAMTGSAKSMPSQWCKRLALYRETRERDMPTPTAQDERVEVRALKGEYQFGFHDPDQSVFRAKKGLDREIVAQISEIKGEPNWMRDYRLRALELFLQKPLPTWGGNVSESALDHIYR